MIGKPIYINGTGSISIQQPLSNEGLENPVSYQETHIRCIEPNFRDFFDPIAARRLSKIIKRAIITAKHAIAESGIETPDAIITGTGLGCVEDTEKFLDAMITNEEKFLQPTFFIQSTHNTISSQIAINMNCKGYNNTYIHRGVSFENALMDAYLLFQRGSIQSAIVTGNDEMTPKYFILLGRIGYWKPSIQNTLTSIQNENSKGSFGAEGSSSLVLATEKSKSTYAVLQGVDLFYKPTESINQKIESFVQSCGLSVKDIDVFMTGMSGDIDNDLVYTNAAKGLFVPEQIGIYKNLCGEYYTNVAYGLLTVAECIKRKEVPAHCMLQGNQKKQVKHILLYNHFRNKDHSLMLLSVC